jgi:hypothetical protein
VPEPFLTTAAAKLSGPLASVVLRSARGRVLGTEDERALQKCLAGAIRNTLIALSSDRAVSEDAPTMGLIATHMERLLGDPVVAEALVDVALESREPPLVLLRERAEVVGLDVATFPVDFDLLMIVLARELTEELRIEARKSSGRLFHRVALTQLDLLSDRIATLEQSHQSPAFGPVSIGAPGPPRILVGRGNDLANVRARLQRDRTIVRGWPGVGKTTLVSALANDAETRAAFPDGVLWVALGQEDRVSAELASAIRRLGTACDESASIADRSALLRSLLHDRRMLVVVDDVWDDSHGLPFCVASPGSATVITTRLTAISDALATVPEDTYVLDVLGDDDALELLGLLAPSVVAEFPTEAAALVNELEGLPLALRVAGRLLQEEQRLGWGVADLLGEIREGAALLRAQAPNDRAELDGQTIPTVRALLQRSTDRLNTRDRLGFAYIGAFSPKPARFGEVEALAVLGPDGRDVIRSLVARGLVEALGNSSFQIHALLAMHARELLITAG